jgi:type IV secretory pathway protease TraF
MTTAEGGTIPRRRLVTWRDGLVGGLLLAGLLSTSWGTINISPSVPLGVYRYVRLDTPLQRGDLVRLPGVPFGRSWLASWLPLLKPVAGLPGEAVCVHPEGLWVHGTYYGAVYQTHKGQPLPVFWGCHPVGEREVFVASHEPKSLDGRYFGMTRVVDARRVVPLWIWRE